MTDWASRKDGYFWCFAWGFIVFCLMVPSVHACFECSDYSGTYMLDDGAYPVPPEVSCEDAHAEFPCLTPTPTPTPTPPSSYCNEDNYHTVVCNGGTSIVKDSVTYTSSTLVSENCYDFGSIPAGTYSTSGGSVVVDSCDVTISECMSNVCGFDLNLHNYMSNLGWNCLMFAGEGDFHNQYSPGCIACRAFIIPAGLFDYDECKAAGNTSVTPTPTPTSTPTPTFIVPDYTPVVPTPTGGGGGSIFPHPTGTISISQTISPVTVPTMVTLPTALPTLPSAINSTTVLVTICGTDVIGNILCPIASTFKTAFDWMTSLISYIVSLILTPVSFATSTINYVFGLENGLMYGFLGGISMYLSVANQILGIFPVKIINMFTFFMLIDIVEQLITLPKVLRSGGGD